MCTWPPLHFISVVPNSDKKFLIPSATAYSCKKSAHPSKAELTVTKTNDIPELQPCGRYASCEYQSDSTAVEVLMRKGDAASFYVL